MLVFFDLMDWVLSILNVRQTQSECRLCAQSLASDVEISIYLLFIEGSLADWEFMMMVVVLMMMVMVVMMFVMVVMMVVMEISISLFIEGSLAVAGELICLNLLAGWIELSLTFSPRLLFPQT